MNGMRMMCVAALLGVLLAACGASSEPRPPEILYGQDVCDSCGMIVDDARFAAATLLAGGETRKFDDIGDMLTYHLDHPEAQVQAWFVHDYATESWIRGETAYFVKSHLHTPMGSGTVAFEDQAAAKAFADETGGVVYDLNELRVEVHTTMHGH